jgi:chitin disaccharide deacetylase
MLIVNADDWAARSQKLTRPSDATKRGRITSVSAMVFMEDSERAAELAKDSERDAGLHFNFSEEFTDNRVLENLESATAG